MRRFSSLYTARLRRPASASPHRRSPGRQPPACWLPVLRSHQSCEVHMGAPPAKRQQQRPLRCGNSTAAWQQECGGWQRAAAATAAATALLLQPLHAALTLHASNSLSDCAETPLPSLVRPFCWSSKDSGSKLTLETRAACRKVWAPSMVSSERFSPESFTVAAWLASAAATACLPDSRQLPCTAPWSLARGRLRVQVGASGRSETSPRNIERRVRSGSKASSINKHYRAAGGSPALQRAARLMHRDPPNKSHRYMVHQLGSQASGKPGNRRELLKKCTGNLAPAISSSRTT